MQVAVFKSGNYSASAQIDNAGRRTSQLVDLRGCSDHGKLIARDRHRFRDREARVYGDDLPIGINRVRSLRGADCSGGEQGTPENHFAHTKFAASFISPEPL